ncbi:MAG: hypothetical protein AAEJ04_01245 [Planctomycetota bacterium]
MTDSKSPERRRFWIPLLLGVSLGVNCIFFVQPPASDIAYGDAADGTNGYIMASFVLQGKGQAEGLAIFDTNTKRLWTGFESGNGFNVYTVRDLSYDFVPQSYSQRGKQKPTVEEMKKGTRK